MNLLKSFPWKAFIVVGIFIILYITLGVIKHMHFLSGYDLAIVDQITWKYAHFKAPITTVHDYAFTSLLADHVEFIYVFLAPLFWIWNNVIALICAQSVIFCLSGIPIYLLARKKGLNDFMSLSLLFSYLLFFGVQNALWYDVHSNVFGTAFIAWMLYFLETQNTLGTFLALLLTISAKEDMAFLTFSIGIVWFLKSAFGKYRSLLSKNFSKIFVTLFYQKNIRNSLLIILISCIYLFLIFGIYFPHFTVDGYRFSYHESLLNSLNIVHFADTVSKRQIIIYSLGWFGFLPLFSPLFLIPWFADLFHYFVLGHLVDTAQQIFLHYRVSLAPLLVLPTIITLSKWKRLQNKYVALYIILCAFAFQYALHLPLSYLTKSWFWHENSSAVSINHTITYLPPTASVVTQVNIAPHIAHRDLIFTLWPDTRDFKSLADSPCGKLQCRWFHWVGSPEYMLIDTSSDFDIRHFLQNRPDFLEAVSTFEKLHKIVAFHREGTTTLYKVLQNP